MSNKESSIVDFFGVIEPYDTFTALTKNTGIIAAIEISGRDPDGLDSFDHAALSAISQRIYGKLNRDISITEYYQHYDGVKISIKSREDEISNTLSTKREDYLNSKNISGSRIVHYFEIEPVENINRLNFISVIKHFGLAAFNEKSRVLLKNKISADKAFLVELAELARMRAILQDAIQEIMSKWKGLCEVKQLTMQEIWAHMRFLANMSPDAEANGLNELVPDEDMDVYLSPGDIKNVVVNDMDVLKVSGVTNRYLKIASVRRFSNQRGKMIPGLWSCSEDSPTRLAGNYLIMTRWKPLSEFQKDLLFQRKHSDLERASLNFSSLLTGGENRSIIEKQAAMKGAIKIKMAELDAAESVPDIWGIGHSYICIFGSDPKKVNATALQMNASASNAKIILTWESVSIEQAYRSIQPAQRLASKRNLYLTSSQFAAASLICQSNKGQPFVADFNDEATYVFKSKDDQPFHYSHIVGGRGLSVCIGRIRSGKTYFKNTIATHYQKYNGFYRAIDIDPGSEIVAQTFGGGVFRVSNEPGHGANFFASYREPQNIGDQDVAFKIHATQLLNAFLLANDAEEYRKLTPDEQTAIDLALDSTLALPAPLRTLSALVSKLPRGLQMKFSRWVRVQPGNDSSVAGWYAHLFDADVDAIGQLQNKVGVFNLQALKASSSLLAPVQLDILYRITQTFEDPTLRHLPKLLDLDEVHYVLGIPGFADYIVSKIRTWGKWFGSIQMWTQSPEELTKTAGWEAIRGAATTFIFMADQNLDAKVYLDAFPFLTSGEIDAIKNLVPQKQAYVIQPELNVSKVIVIDVDPEQHVINTSSPKDAAERDNLIAQYGFEEGMRIAVEKYKARQNNVSVEKPVSEVVSRLINPDLISTKEAV